MYLEKRLPESHRRNKAVLGQEAIQHRLFQAGAALEKRLPESHRRQTGTAGSGSDPAPALPGRCGLRGGNLTG